MHHRSGIVAEDLHLHVTGPLEIALHVELAGPERGLSAAVGRGERGREIGRSVEDVTLRAQDDRLGGVLFFDLEDAVDQPPRTIDVDYEDSVTRETLRASGTL